MDSEQLRAIVDEARRGKCDSPRHGDTCGSCVTCLAWALDDAALATPDAAPRSADASPDYAQEVMRLVDCTGMDDHDPDPCPKCSAIRQALTDLAQRVAREAKADGFKAGVEAAASEIEDSAIGLTGPGSDDLRAFIAKQVEIVYCLLASPSIPECGTCGGKGVVADITTDHREFPDHLMPCPDCQGGE